MSESNEYQLFGKPVIETGHEKPPDIVFESWEDFWKRKAREKAMSEKGIDPDSKQEDTSGTVHGDWLRNVRQK